MQNNFYNNNGFATNTTAFPPVGNTNTGGFANFSGFSTMGSTNANLNNIKLDTTLESPPQVPKPKLKVILNNNERGYYSALLSQADPVNSNSVQGKEAVTFFKRSGLGVEVLKKIWLIASSNNTSLEREEFYVALKLIAFAQNNIDVSSESIIKNLPTPLPKFITPAPEKKEEKIEEVPQNQPNINNDVIPPTIVGGQVYSNPTPLNVVTTPSHSNSIVGNLLPQGQNKILSETECKINLEKMHKYENIFKTLDLQHTGYVGGAEAKEIFIKSGLQTQQLFQIWKLVDTKKEGNLSKGEFMVALHLIMLARQGFNLPQELPKTLMDVVIEYYPSNTTITTLGHRQSQHLINVGEIKTDDKYSALESVETAQDNQNNLNAFNKEKMNENAFKNQNTLQRVNSQKMDLTGTEPQQQNVAFSQTQNELNNELMKLRNYHSNTIQEKTQDLNNFNSIIENYQRLMKKLQDENLFLIEESKKIEDKKNIALKTIMSYQNNIDMLLNKNLEIKQKIIYQSTKAIDEISETAKTTIDQINQSSKNISTENQNMTLLQRKQLLQEERDKEKNIKVDNIPKQQAFPKNFDSDNFPVVEQKLNENINYSPDPNKNNSNPNSFNNFSGTNPQITTFIAPETINNNINNNNIDNFNNSPPKNLIENMQNTMPPLNNIQNPIHFNNNNMQNPMPFNNNMSNNLSNNMPNQMQTTLQYPITVNNSQNLQNAMPFSNQNQIPLNNMMNKSSIESPPRPLDSFNKTNPNTDMIKNFDSDQKDFANFGGFDMNQQDFNNGGTGWGEFENNFKPGLEEQKNQNPPNSNQGFGGFSEFKF